MKHGKSPNRRERQAMKQAKLNPDNWLVFKKDSEYLHLVHRETGTTKSILF